MFKIAIATPFGAKTRSGVACKRSGNTTSGCCHLHGGKSTGPRTDEGRARIAAAHFKHGNRTKQAIAKRRESAAIGRMIRRELVTLETESINRGLLSPKWRDEFELR